MTDDQVEVEVARAPDETKNKLVVKVHRARRLFGGGYGLEAVGATHPYVRAVYGDQTRETACRRRTTSPCWQEELIFEARGATTVKLAVLLAQYVHGRLVLGRARPRRALFPLGAAAARSSWFSLEPEKRPTGPEDFLYRHRNALGSVLCVGLRCTGTLSPHSHVLSPPFHGPPSHLSESPRRTLFPRRRATAHGPRRQYRSPTRSSVKTTLRIRRTPGARHHTRPRSRRTAPAAQSLANLASSTRRVSSRRPSNPK